MRMLRFTRRGAVMAAAALALAACGSSTDGGESDTSSNGSDSNQVVLQDVIFGDPDAPVTLIEYASWTCPACLDFHQNEAPVATSSATQVRKPLYSSSMGRWKSYRPAMDPALEILHVAGLI